MRVPTGGSLEAWQSPLWKAGRWGHQVPFWFRTRGGGVSKVEAGDRQAGVPLNSKLKAGQPECGNLFAV